MSKKFSAVLLFSLVELIVLGMQGSKAFSKQSSLSDFEGAWKFEKGGYFDRQSSVIKKQI
jgi:hypothetical protein